MDSENPTPTSSESPDGDRGLNLGDILQSLAGAATSSGSQDVLPTLVGQVLGSDTSAPETNPNFDVNALLDQFAGDNEPGDDALRATGIPQVVAGKVGVEQSKVLLILRGSCACWPPPVPQPNPRAPTRQSRALTAVPVRTPLPPSPSPNRSQSPSQHPNPSRIPPPRPNPNPNQSRNRNPSRSPRAPRAWDSSYRPLRDSRYVLRTAYCVMSDFGPGMRITEYAVRIAYYELHFRNPQSAILTSPRCLSHGRGPRIDAQLLEDRLQMALDGVG